MSLIHTNTVQYTSSMGYRPESALFQLATRFWRSDDGSTKISSLGNSYLDSVSSAYTLPEYVFSDHHIRIQLWIQSIYRVPTFSNRSTEIGSVEDSSTKGFWFWYEFACRVCAGDRFWVAYTKRAGTRRG